MVPANDKMAWKERLTPGQVKTCPSAVVSGEHRVTIGIGKAAADNDKVALS